RALEAYRKSTPSSPRDSQRPARVVAACAVALWASTVVSAMRDHDGLASHLAASSAAFCAIAPLVAWSGADRLLEGLVAFGAKLAFALVITFYASMRRPEQSWFTLFWWGPATMLVATLAEAWLFSRSRPS